MEPDGTIILLPIPAFLFANATVATFTGRRANTIQPRFAGDGTAFAPTDDRPSAVDHQATNIPVAALGDAAETLLAAARSLLWYET